MSSKNRMLVAVISLIFFGFLVTSMSNFYVSRQNSIEALVSAELPLSSGAIYSEVQRDLIAPQIVSSVMSNDTFVREWIKNGEIDDSKITAYLSEIAKEYSAFIAFLVVDASLNYYGSNGFIKKVSKDDKRDEWYFRIKESNELIELNIDPAEGKGDQLTLFFNVRMEGNDEEFIAVIGLGLNRDLLSSKLENYREKFGHNVYFVTPEGKTFLHKESEYEGVDIRTIEGLGNIADQLLTIDDEQMTYNQDGNEILVHARYIKEIDLFLLVEANMDTAMQKLYRSLFLNIFICLLITLAVLIVLLKTISRYQSRLESIAWRDCLTGLRSRQAFDDDYDRQFKNHAKAKQSMSLLLLDIDYFKRINDKYGHITGDKVLKEFSRLFKKAAPSNALITRWGGEEFVCLLVNTNEQEAYSFAEKLRKKVESSSELKAFLEEGVTVSIGVIQCDLKLGVDANLQKADKLMYEAKANGRNQVLSANSLNSNLLT